MSQPGSLETLLIGALIIVVVTRTPVPKKVGGVKKYEDCIEALRNAGFKVVTV